MALKLVLYMRYLQDRGGEDLLRVLTEDGAFGCWTADVPGYGKVYPCHIRSLVDGRSLVLEVRPPFMTVI